MSHTPGPWHVAMSFEGPTLDAPSGLNDEQRAEWNRLMAERNQPMRENSGAFIIMAESRIGTADIQVQAKRGRGYLTDDPEGLANARLIAAAPEMFAVLKTLLHQKSMICDCGIADEIFDEARAAIAKAEGK